VWFDKLTTNEINHLPFVLSSSKDLFRASLTRADDPACSDPHKTGKHLPIPGWSCEL